MKRPLLSLLTPLLVAHLTAALPAFAAKPLGNPTAPKGGTFTVGMADYPKHLLFYLGFDEMSAGINSLILEPLVDVDVETNELVPLLASEWTVSKDKMIFTFKINPQAKFSDGKPVTAEDVKFTWDTLLNPKNKTVPFQSFLESFQSCNVKDNLTVEFVAKTLHFKNLEKIASIVVLPKHFFSEGDFNKAFHTRILGSGPYTLEEAKQGDKVVLKRNPDYWGAKLPLNVGKYNFDRLVFKAVPEYSVQHEMFKRGDIDYFYFLTAKMWATETDGAPYKNNYIRKLKATNLQAFATQGIAWNMRRPLFQDKRVRYALSHLFNRERMIKELFYNNYEIAAGIVGMRSDYHSPKNKPVPYNPEAARKLLKEAGWNQVDKDGTLMKDGQRFEFEFLTNNSSGLRYLTIYQEDLKKAGIKMNIRQQDWASSLKVVDDRQFDATDIARGRDTEPADFNVMWGTAEADMKGSGNLTGFKNAEVDALNQKVSATFDRKARIPLVRKIDEIIASEQPLSFAWEPSYTRLAYWDRFGFPGKGYFNYTTWMNAFHYWWYDAEKDKKLQAAMKAKVALP